MADINQMYFPMRSLKSVLLVEDDKDDQYFFVTALSEIKNVTLFDVVDNGKEALERLRNSIVLPAFIFMDINMPLMNGMECLHKFSKNQRLSTIPIVMLSSNTDLKEQTLDLGARAFIKKPDTIGKLRDELEKIIQLDIASGLSIASMDRREG